MDTCCAPSSDEAKWKAENDCDALMKAEEIKADSKRFKAAMRVAEERNDNMKRMMDSTRPMSMGDK